MYVLTKVDRDTFIRHCTPRVFGAIKPIDYNTHFKTYWDVLNRMTETMPEEQWATFLAAHIHIQVRHKELDYAWFVLLERSRWGLVAVLAPYTADAIMTDFDTTPFINQYSRGILSKKRVRSPIARVLADATELIHLERLIKFVRTHRPIAQVRSWLSSQIPDREALIDKLCQ